MITSFKCPSTNLFEGSAKSLGVLQSRKNACFYGEIGVFLAGCFNRFSRNEGCVSVDERYFQKKPRMSSNPFSTRYTKPGAIAFRFDDSCDSSNASAREIARLLDCIFATDPKCWQIVGPHGSGKSTLVNMLLAAFPTSVNFEHFVLRDGQRVLPGTPTRDNQLIAIDGYEQLGWLARQSLKRHVKRSRQRLLVTAHRDVGFETLFKTHVSRETVRNIVQELLHGQPTSSRIQQVIADEVIDGLLLKHGQNVREMLFELYDVWSK